MSVSLGTVHTHTHTHTHTSSILNEIKNINNKDSFKNHV